MSHDPRQPEKVRAVEWNTEDPEQADLPQMLMMSASMAALMMRKRILAWLALLAVIVGLVNSPMARIKDVKYVLVASASAIMALVMAYFGQSSLTWS